MYRRKIKQLTKRTVLLIFYRKIVKSYAAEARIQIAVVTVSAAVHFLPINNVPFYMLPTVCPKTKNGFWFPLSIARVLFWKRLP